MQRIIFTREHDTVITNVLFMSDKRAYITFNSKEIDKVYVYDWKAFHNLAEDKVSAYCPIDFDEDK